MGRQRRGKKKWNPDVNVRFRRKKTNKWNMLTFEFALEREKSGY